MFSKTLERDIDGSFLEATEELFEMILDYKYESLPSGRSIIEKFKVNHHSINLYKMFRTCQRAGIATLVQQQDVDFLLLLQFKAGF